jgi:hypothetical protein
LALHPFPSTLFLLALNPDAAAPTLDTGDAPKNRIDKSASRDVDIAASISVNKKGEFSRAMGGDHEVRKLT